MSIRASDEGRTVGARTVLVVEDDEVYAARVGDLVRARGIDVHLASTLEEALSCIEDLPELELVILDLSLPGIRGVDGVVEIHSRAPQLPIVVLTGNESVLVAREAIRLGAQEFLVKGQAEEVLIPRAIDTALERKRSQEFEQLLLGLVGHDLRSPLQAITLSAEMLAMGETLAAQKPIIERLARSAARANALVASLLDLTRLRQTGKLPIERRATDLVALVGDLVNDAQLLHPDRVLEFEHKTFGGGIWDRDRLAQVVSNLIENALRHGDKTRPVSVTLSGDASFVEITVKNHGNPIASELLPKLFVPLTQQSAHGSGRGGIGLGLYIVAQIVSAHEGFVDVRSSEGEGTIFRCTLPRKPTS